MIKDLMNIGMKTVVMIDPGIKVDDDYWVFKEGKEKRFFCPVQMHSEGAKVAGMEESAEI